MRYSADPLVRLTSADFPGAALVKHCSALPDAAANAWSGRDMCLAKTTAGLDIWQQNHRVLKVLSLKSSVLIVCFFLYSQCLPEIPVSSILGSRNPGQEDLIFLIRRQLGFSFPIAPIERS